MHSNLSGTDPNILGIGFLIAAFFCILGGVINLGFKDIVWRVAKWNNEIKGVPSQRTKSWEQMTAASGCGCIILGAFFFFIALSLFGKTPPSNATVTEGVTITSPVLRPHKSPPTKKPSKKPLK